MFFEGKQRLPSVWRIADASFTIVKDVGVKGYMGPSNEVASMTFSVLHVSPWGAWAIRIRKNTFCFMFCALMLAGAVRATAQTTSSDPQGTLPNAPQSATATDQAVTLRGLPWAIVKDQGVIWTSPVRIRASYLIYLAPLAVATGAAVATDHHVMASVVSHSPDFNNTNVNASNVLIGGLIAAPVAFYGLGQFRDDSHQRETGILGAEALVDGVVVEQGLKLIFWRERPASHNARGSFFLGDAGVDSSFPSSHSLLAWSSAAVIAGEYPSRWTQIGVYSLAGGVSLTRVLGQEHFPADVLVGSAAGWLIGHYVFRAHHRYLLLRGN